MYFKNALYNWNTIDCVTSNLLRKMEDANEEIVEKIREFLLYYPVSGC